MLDNVLCWRVAGSHLHAFLGKLVSHMGGQFDKNFKDYRVINLSTQNSILYTFVHLRSKLCSGVSAIASYVTLTIERTKMPNDRRMRL